MTEHSVQSLTVVQHTLHMMILPLHYAAIMGLEGVTSWISAGALLLYLGVHAHQFALARRPK